VGEHPGTEFLVVLLFMGFLAGHRGGIYGMLGGAASIAVVFVPVYLCGAYGSANDSDSYAREEKL
jgi:hypothetical protein